MMHLEIGGQRIPIAAGETFIGSASDCGIVLPGEGVRPRHAILLGTAQGAAAIRAASSDAELIINGVRLGADPTPVLHGDKIEIGGHEILAVDSRRTGHTQLFDSGAFTDLLPSQRPAKPSATGGPTGGRLVCLTDGREYTLGTEPLVFGRDAGADVVVAGSEVSRRHAEIQTTPEGYVLMDLSVNGSYVNGERVGRRHLLARADVIRIGHDEFRFYADAAPPPQPRGPRSVPVTTNPVGPPTGAGARLSDTMHGLPVSGASKVATPTAPTVAPLASLMVRSGELKGRRLPIKVPIVNIGRAEFNDVVLPDPSVSTSHAKLQRRENIWIISDSASTNGTYVDGEQVEGEVALGPGATLRFGDVSVLFEPLDDRAPVRRTAGTRLVEALDLGQAAPSESPAADQTEPGPETESATAGETSGRYRRPIRATVPRPEGPPVWLLVVLVLVGAALAYFLLR
jgi:pSer/pThr/pTyr-binding forkhead associated (FHA) protein